MAVEEMLRKSRKKEFKRGVLQGINQGISQAREEIIIQMIKNNIEDNTISKIANISEQELLQIKRKIKHNDKNRKQE